MTLRTKVLVVDDDRVVQLANQAMLTSMGCDVDFAANGDDALQLLEKVSFDYVLLDIHMPKLNGIDMVKKLREGASQNKSVFVIGLTADNNEKQLLNAKKAGMTVILLKPVNISILKKYIQCDQQNI